MAERSEIERGRMRDAGSPFAAFIEPFLAGRGLLPKSRGDYSRYLRFFDEFTGRTDLRTALTMENGRGFRERLKERGRSHTASRNGTMYLKSLASWLAETGTLTTSDGGSVLARLKAPRTPKSNREALSEPDLEAIWVLLADRPKRERYRAIALVRLLRATGLGRSGIASLLFKDVEFDANGTAGWITTRTTRSGKTGGQRIRLDAETGAAILQYFEEERPQYEGRPPEPLFINERGHRFTLNGFGSWINRIGEDIEKATGIKWSPGVMRLTWKEESSAPFRDPELRSRCMEILNGEGNYDQAVMAACQVLEARIRDTSGAPPSHRSGVTLMKFAFGKPVQLRLSDDDNEQLGALEMFTGLMTYYRNPAAHRIRDDLDKREVIRIVTWIDHLLTLVGRADRPFGRAAGVV
jgi:uncharacterized protein (TIGR02391 family)